MIRLILFLSILLLIVACNDKSKTATKESTTSRPQQQPTTNPKVIPIKTVNDLTTTTAEPLRKELLNAIRIPVEQDLKQEVKFEVQLLRENGVYAFLSGRPRNSTGGKIDFSSTKYSQYYEDG